MTEVDKINLQNQHEKKSLMQKKFIVTSSEGFRASLKEIANWSDKELSHLSIPSDKKWIPSLCLEEVVTNIILHGIEHFPSEILIDISLQTEGLLKLSIVDTGKFFDILSHISVRKENQVGGGGIPLIRSLMNIEQKCEKGHNFTILYLKF